MSRRPSLSPTTRLLRILCSEAVVGDAGGAVQRAADEAEAVGQQRQGGHSVCVVREDAQDGADNTVKLLNVNDGAVLRIFKHHSEIVSSLALLPDGLRFVSGSFDDTACIVEHRLAAFSA